MDKRRLFLYAFKISIPVMLGYVFLGAAFGILLQRAGYGWPWALLISVVVYAGSMQFALVPLLTAATPTGRPKYQLICTFAARQSVPCSAPRRTSVR